MSFQFDVSTRQAELDLSPILLTEHDSIRFSILHHIDIDIIRSFFIHSTMDDGTNKTITKQ